MPSNKPRCGYCGETLTMKADSHIGYGYSEHPVEHETDICIRNLLVKLVSNDERRMRFDD